MTIRLLTRCEYEQKWMHLTEVIHCQPTVLLRGVVCVSCVVDIHPAMPAYPLTDGEHLCKSCAHYMHERMFHICLICNKEEVNSMEQEVMITPEGNIVISDDVVADIPLMRRVEE